MRFKIPHHCLDAARLLALSLAAGLGAGCASTGGTVRELQVQTGINRQLLAIQRQRTNDLLAQRANLQAQIDRSRQRLMGLESSSSADPAVIANVRKEIADREREVAALNRIISEAE